MSEQQSTSEDQETSSLEQVLDCEEHTVAEQIEEKYCQGISSIAVAMHILCVCLLIACRA